MRCITPGVNTSSGFVSVFVSHSGTLPNSPSVNTGLTLTYGTAAANTIVRDTTDTYAYSAGDTLQVRVATQASETLASCIVSMNY